MFVSFAGATVATTIPAGPAASPTATATSLAAFCATAGPTPTGGALRLAIDRHWNGDAALQHDLNGVARHVDSDDLAVAAGRVQHGADLWHTLLGLNIIIVFV